MSVLTLASQVCTIALGIQKLINYNKDKIDDLELEPVIDLVEIRKQLLALQEILNKEVEVVSAPIFVPKSDIDTNKMPCL